MRVEKIYGDVTFVIEIVEDKRGRKKKYLVGYRYDNISIGIPRTLLSRNGLPRTFFVRTMDLYKNKKLKAVEEFLMDLGVNLPIDEIEKEYENAEKYIQEEREKWKRIKKAWGLWTF